MPPTIFARPDNGPIPTSTPVPATGDGPLQAAWDTITGSAAGLTALALTTALLGAATVYLLMRRPTKTDFSKHLMYVPLLLVNAAAVYGQVAFFYDQVAPHTWPVLGKLALSALIAAAVESIAVYVGWHAHDALLNKASATAARLRRASYVIALIVGGINYAHFAGDNLTPNAAAIAFGLLSLLSPWLWGLHTRRAQHVQLSKEGAVDATGATFSIERIRSFPIRAYLARRWSVDHYVTDPREAWQGYNADLRTRWADSVDSPGWWMRTNPVARVKQLTAALDVRRQTAEQSAAEAADLTEKLSDTEAELTAAGQRIADDAGRLSRLIAERDALTGELDETRASNEDLTARLTEQTHETAAVRAEVDRTGKAKDARIGELETALTDLEVRLTGEKVDALKKNNAEWSVRVATARAEARVTKLDDRRPRQTGTAGKGSAGKAFLTDEAAVQIMLTAQPDPSHEWSKNSVRTLTGVGLDRAEKLIPLWFTAATEQAGGKREAVNQ